MATYRTARRNGEPCVKRARATPSAAAPATASTTDATMAVLPDVTNQGSRGRRAPSEKDTNDEHRGPHRRAQGVGIDPQLFPGVGAEGRLGIDHHLLGQLAGQIGVDPTGLVELGQLHRLDVGVALELPALDRQLPLEQLLLGLHGAVLPRGHRHRAGDQAGEPSQADHAGAGIGPGHTEDQGDVGDEAVAGPEDRGPGHTALDVAVVVLADRRARSGIGHGPTVRSGRADPL